MIEVDEMNDAEIEAVLGRLNYGHLACARDNIPYVVPIHYAYERPFVYIYTTEGKKSQIIDENPMVCLQVEDVADNERWVSIIVNGEAEQLTDQTEREKAVAAVARINPTLTPAISIHWMDNWVRENIEVVYRIMPSSTSGRMSSKGSAVNPFKP